jgi:hypothetical protein
MKLNRTISLILCLSLILIGTGLSSITYATPNSVDNDVENVVTESDAGGGDITSTELILIILAAVGVFFVIILIAAAA